MWPELDHWEGEAEVFHWQDRRKGRDGTMSPQSQGMA